MISRKMIVGELENKVFEGMKFKVWRKYFDEKGNKPLQATIIDIKYPKFIVIEIQTHSFSYNETVYKSDFTKKLKEGSLISL